MLPLFANPAGLWALLGIPTILAIHFLQQRTRVARTSTWFLIERLAPDSAKGRTWDRLRASRQLWLQLFAVLLAAWILAEPRWLRAESAQTVVIVLDDSAAMEAFRVPARAAAEEEMRRAEGLAARTTWVVMTTNPRQPALYRGLSRADASATLARWQPELGGHDLQPALRLARTLAGAMGRTLFITDTRAKVPADQRAVGVGHPIENVGVAGGTITHENGAHVWRALVKNHATTTQRRTWQLEVPGGTSTVQSIELAPGALTELSARLPEGIERATVVLAADGFTLDDRLPLIVPRPKPLTVAVEGADDAAEFFRKLAQSVDGVSLASTSSPSTLRLARLTAADVAREPRGGVFWPPADARAQAPLLTDPVTPERDPLVNGLNWQGWLGTGPYGFTTAPGDRTLLWHGRWPLVFVRGDEGATDQNLVVGENRPKPARKLLLAFDWATSNAARLPATVLLMRRFLETERDAQRAPYAANFDSGSRVPITGVPLEGEFTLEREPAERSDVPTEMRVIPPAERTNLRAPGRAGFFTARRDGEVLVRGATQFSDPRQSDFRAAERFVTDVRSERAAAIERNTAADPFTIGWLLLIGAAMLGSWWSRSAAPAKAETRRVDEGAAYPR